MGVVVLGWGVAILCSVKDLTQSECTVCQSRTGIYQLQSLFNENPALSNMCKLTSSPPSLPPSLSPHLFLPTSQRPLGLSVLRSFASRPPVLLGLALLVESRRPPLLLEPTASPPPHHHSPTRNANYLRRTIRKAKQKNK